MMEGHEQKINEVKSRMQRLSGQAAKKEPPTPAPPPNIPLGRSENGRPIVLEDREVPLHIGFRFRDFKIHGVISDGKDCISYTNLSKQIDSALSKGYEEKGNRRCDNKCCFTKDALMIVFREHQESKLKCSASNSG